MAIRKPAGPATKSKNRHVLSVVLGAALCLSVMLGSATAQVDTVWELTQWPVSEGGNGHWYGLSDATVSWDEAVTLAASFQKDGVVGHLATVASESENQFILSRVFPTGHLYEQAFGNEFWLGASSWGSWQWLTGEPFVYANWADGFPLQMDTIQALAMRGFSAGDPCLTCPATGQWFSRPTMCGTEGAYCLTAVIEFDTDPVSDTLLCVMEWPISEGGNGHWYGFLPTKLTWDQARIAAAQFTKNGLPGHLATITSSQEDDFAFRTVSFDPIFPIGRVGNHWLGGYDDSSWAWVTREPMVYTNWAIGQPVYDEANPALAMVGPPWTDCPLCPQPSQWVAQARDLMLSSIIEFETEPIEPRVILVPEDYPFIQTAIDSARNGDMVLVSPGVYNESLNFHGKNITVRSAEGPSLTVITNQRTVNLVTFENGESHDAVLEGFTLSGGWIAVLCSNSAPTIRRNVCVGQNVWNWSAICLAGPLDTIADPTGDPRYHANLGYAPAIIENNTIVNSANGGISMFSITSPTLRNNIVAFNANYGIHQQSLTEQEPPIMGYNDVFGQGDFDGSPHGDYINIPDPGPGAISQDPLFSNDFAATWKLGPGSPCINTGDPDPMYNDPDGSRNDMGAMPFEGIVEPDTLYVPSEYPTIQLAIDASHNGDLVLVSPGTYQESLNYLGKNIAVHSTEGPLQTTITNDRTMTLVSFDHGETHDAVLDGFTLAGGWIAVMCSNSAPTIRHNICVRQNVWNWAAICLAGPLDTIFDPSGDPRYHANLGYAPAIIENNTIVNSTNGGISMFSITPPTIRNNIVAFNANYGIHQQSLTEQEPPIMGYNDVFGQGDFDGGPHGDYINIPNPGPGAISADPLFNVEQLVQEWTLSQGSPCINTGDPDPMFNDPDGSRNDMGAVPYGGGSGGEPIPTNEWIIVFCNQLRPDDVAASQHSVITAYDPQGVLCGQAIRYWEGSFGLMPIYRDDPYTEVDEGCVPGDLIQFMIDGQPVQPTTPVYWTANGDIFEVCEFGQSRCLDIPLHTGWNLVSWNVAYDESRIRLALDEIIVCVDVVLSYEQGGLMFDPALGDEFNTLTGVDYHHGYWIRMNCDAVLQVCGNPIQTDQSISLEPGWNLVSYWPERTMPVENGFASIIDSLQEAMGFDQGAQVWLPHMWGLNTLTELRPTFGYWAKVPTFMTLTYPDHTNPDSVIVWPGGSGSPELPLAEMTRDWMSVYGSNITVDGKPVADGSMIEFYTDGSIMCGRGVYSGNILRLTPVYGNDASGTVSKHYPKEGDQLEIRVNGERAYPNLAWSGSGARVQLTRLSSDSRGLPETFDLAQNFPNPFNPATTIPYDVPSDGQVTLSIYNVLGQEVRTLVNGYCAAGRNRVEWDGTDNSGQQVSTGVYLYRLVAGETTLTKKMLLLK